MNDKTFFEKAARLDTLIREGDPRSVMDSVIELLDDDAIRRYFFGRLDRPEWLIPLRERGFFDKPPQFVSAEGRVGFPPWSEGRYLARVAALVPESVLDIALQVPEAGNFQVHQDLVEAALAMPPEFSARLFPKAESWLEVPDQMIIPEMLGKLLEHLTEGRQVGAALKLARALLALRAEDRTIGDYTFTDPRPRFDM